MSAIGLSAAQLRSAVALQRAKRLAPSARVDYLAQLDTLTRDQLKYAWDLHARPEQHPPPTDWTYWLIKAGRGFGKTRVLSEMARRWVKHYDLVNIIGATSDDVRDILIEGESGILAICPDDERPKYIKGERKLAWPNGAVSLLFTAEEPDRLRGKQHKKLLCDELAAWRYVESWDQAQFGLRLGNNPQAVIATTPRPIKIIKELVADPTCVVTHGTTYDNRANLAPAFYNKIIQKYEGTRLGRQELNAEIISDVVGALWTADLIDSGRVQAMPTDLIRVVVGVDPKVGSGILTHEDKRSLKQYGVTLQESESECGIVTCAKDSRYPPHYYVIADDSLDAAPTVWASAAVKAYKTYGADRVIGEVNNGGELVEAVIRTVDEDASYRAVRASRGKLTRAEPIAALSEQGRLHLVGSFAKLEDQCCTYIPGQPSPDRMDAMVWAVTELMDEGEHGGLIEYYRREAERIKGPQQ